MSGFAKRRMNKAAWILAMSLLLSAVCVAWPMCSRAAARTLRVGYIDLDGFVNENNGIYTGYGVDYLKEVAEYTGWEYEFVLDSWENCLERLEEGDLDMVCNAQYTEERAKHFAFANIPFGYESMVLYVRDDADVYYDDYNAMQGFRVGLLEGSYQTELFKEYAKTHGITYEPVPFPTNTDISDALMSGDVDMAAVGSLGRHEGVRVVGRYGAEPFYCMTALGNEDLMEEMDRALQSIRVNSPSFENELMQHYYGESQMSESPLFTREEHDFIEDAGRIDVRVMQDYLPMSQLEDGKVTGILPEFIRLLGVKSGLNIRPVANLTASDIKDETQELNEDDFLIIRSDRAAEAERLMDGMVASHSMMNTTLSYVMRQKDTVLGRDDYCFALTREMTYLEDLIHQESGKFTTKYYDTPQDCMDAVLHGEVDFAIQYSYVVAYWMQRPIYADRLVESSGMQVQVGLCFIASAQDEQLIDILDKTINFISDADESRIITSQLLMNPYKGNFMDFVFRYRSAIITTGIFLLLIAVVGGIAINRKTKLKIERRENEILQRQAWTDDVTGVYNRRAFYEKARERIDSTGESMCIILMDIINFKVVNDLYGMEAGDKLLQEIAGMLLELGKDRNFIIARFTGDHFYICMSMKDFREIHLPRHLHTFLEDMEIKADYGVFMVDENRDMPINIMCDRANIAVHDRDDRQPGYIRYYNDEARDRILRVQEIENDMEKALASNQFCIYVQPKYDITNDEVIGGEALVRWKHPTKGMIPPGIFVGIFEQNGFILRLDYFVWEETCKLIHRMREEGISVEGKPISINVSRVHFYGTELKKKLDDLVEKYQLDKDDLELEITETVCAEDSGTIYKKIQELQDSGFKIAMDDFGSGYSSLNMLKEMPLDILKMDLKFLDDGGDSEKGHKIMQTLIALAQSLNLKVIVEGVETKDQVEFLRSIGSYYVQGFYYSRPIEASAYEELLRKSTSGKGNAPSPAPSPVPNPVPSPAPNPVPSLVSGQM